MSDIAHEHEQIRKQTAHNNEAVTDSTPDLHPLATLQRMIGNRAVQRLVTPGGKPLQTKMSVTSASDPTEAEADAVAEQVVRKVQRSDEDISAKRIQREAEEEISAKRIQREEGGEMEEEEISAKRIQREEGGEMEEEEISAKRIQREEGGEMEEEEISAKRIQRAGGDMMGAFNVGSDFETSLESARGGGKAIDEGVRGKLEGAMGADFSGVRVHEDKSSDSLNQSIQAKAFTTGSDIFFRSGEYNPSSTDGQKLLAHELTHTIQQGAVNTKREEAS